MKNVFDYISYEQFKNYNETEIAKEYTNKSLVIGVIDSIFSISSKYESTVKVVDRFASYVKINKQTDEYFVSQFVNEFKDFTPDRLAKEVFKNKQRTSTTNGILKAEAVKKVIDVLYKHNIETKTYLLNYKNIFDIEKEIKQIKGQNSGVSFHYIMMHAGDFNRFKPDRHIYNFFENYLEYGEVDYDRLKELFNEQLNIVKSKYPKFTLRALDNLIWNFMKERDSKYTTTGLDFKLSFIKYKFLENKKWYVYNKKLEKFLLTNYAPDKVIDSYIEYLNTFKEISLDDFLDVMNILDNYLGEKLFEQTKIAINKMINIKRNE